jgi:hypothetical protein
VATPTTIDQEVQLAGAVKSALQRAAREAGRAGNEEKALTRLPPVQEDRPNVPHDRVFVRTHADLTAMAIISITRYAVSADLTDILKKIGYSPTIDDWKDFPPQRQLEMALRAAEKAKTGGGDDVLACVAQELALHHESVRYDGNLNRFLAVPANPSIKFSEIAVSSPPSSQLPMEIRRTINAIVGYCDACAVLAGIDGILINHLKLEPNIAYDILVSSKSRSEAFERGFRRLELAVAIERTKEIVNIVQDAYESARHIAVLNEFRALPTPYYLKPEQAEEFYSGLRAGIERENRVGAQAENPSELRAPAPVP